MPSWLTPGLNELGVSVDLHRKEQRQPLICFAGEKALRTWWEADEGQARGRRLPLSSTISLKWMFARTSLRTSKLNFESFFASMKPSLKAGK